MTAERRANGGDAEVLWRARRLLREARGLVVLTGAGISADSGVATFRGDDGLWKRYRPEELATPQAFARDPRLVWEWYAMRRRAIAAAVPNAAHLALARLALRREDVLLVTQNVDGLHALAARQVLADGSEIPMPGDDPGPTMPAATPLAAGAETPGVEMPGAGTPGAETESAQPAGRHRGPLELHGCLFRVRCTACGDRREHRGAIDHTSKSSLPRCRRCEGLLRPDVVWFGETLGDELQRAMVAAAEAEACLVVGTSGVVYPAAAEPSWRTKPAPPSSRSTRSRRR